MAQGTSQAEEDTTPGAEEISILNMNQFSNWYPHWYPAHETDSHDDGNSTTDDEQIVVDFFNTHKKILISMFESWKFAKCCSYTSQIHLLDTESTSYLALYDEYMLERFGLMMKKDLLRYSADEYMEKIDEWFGLLRLIHKRRACIAISEAIITRAALMWNYCPEAEDSKLCDKCEPHKAEEFFHPCNYCQDDMEFRGLEKQSEIKIILGFQCIRNPFAFKFLDKLFEHWKSFSKKIKPSLFGCDYNMDMLTEQLMRLDDEMPTEDDLEREHLLHNGRYKDRRWFIFHEEDETFSWKPVGWTPEDDLPSDSDEDEAEDEDQPPTDDDETADQTVEEEQSKADETAERMDIDSQADGDASRLDDGTANVGSAQPTVATSSTDQPDQVCKESITY